MSGACWRIGRLGDALLDIEAGVSPKALDRPAKSGELGVLKVSAVTWKEFRPHENKALSALFNANGCPRVRRGDLLLSRANTAELLASPVLVHEDHPNLLLSDKTLRLVPNLKIVETRYLLHALRTWPVRRFFESHATGTSGSMRNVSQATILACPIPLPSIEQQRRIAEVLDRAEALRAKRRAALAQLDTLTQAIFLDMFGGSLGGNGRSVLSDVAEVVSGVAKGRKLSGRQAMVVPYLRVANVQAGFLDLTEIKRIEALPSEVHELSLKPGDVLLTEGGDHDKLGRGAMWQGQIEGCIHQNHVFRVRTHGACLLARFFLEFLQTPAARAYFLRCAKRTTNLASINMTQLRALSVPLPPVEQQLAFVRSAGRVEQLRATQRASLAQLDALFASLQHRAFRGEL